MLVLVPPVAGRLAVQSPFMPPGFTLDLAGRTRVLYVAQYRAPVLIGYVTQCPTFPGAFTEGHLSSTPSTRLPLRDQAPQSLQRNRWNLLTPV